MDEQAKPFGINECWLLPGSLRDKAVSTLNAAKVVRIVSTSLDAMQETLGDYEGMAEACEKYRNRKHVLDTHASFAASLARISSIQLDGTVPRKCDDSQEEIISKMNASCERVKSTVAPDAHSLEEKTAEEFENVTFGMAHALTRVHAEVVSLSDGAKTPREAKIFKRTLLAIRDRVIDLIDHLANFRNQLSMPFGDKDDGLLPPKGPSIPNLQNVSLLQGQIKQVTRCF